MITQHISCDQTRMASYQRNMFEGIGAPVQLPDDKYGNIDPTLDSCCQREVRERVWYSY